MTRPPLHFITPVWGLEFSRCFVEICLPTLLAPGNIPALENAPGNVYQIYTSPDDQRFIENSVAFQALTRHIRVEFHPIRARVDAITNHYFIQSDCYRLGIKIAGAADAAMVFLNADVVVADGGVRALLALLDRGKRAALAMGVRVNKQALAAELQAYRTGTPDAAIAIAPRALARLATAQLHQISRTHLYRNDEDGLNPASLLWPVGADGLLMRCFHLHPLLVYPRRKSASFTTTIDNDYLEAACPDPADTHIIQDSDEFLACELSDAKRRIPAMARSGEDIDIARWAQIHANDRHRELLTVPIRLHNSDISEPGWQAALAQSDDVVARVLALLRRPAALGSQAEILAYVNAQALPRHVPLHFVTPVWGEEYTRNFLDITLPTLLAPGNIPSLPNAVDCYYTIYTTPFARGMIEASSAYALLKKFIPAEIRLIPTNLSQKYHASSYCYREAVREAARAGAAAIFFIPDMILSDGSVRSIARILNSGKRAIMITGLRVIKNHIVGPLKAQCGTGDVITAPPTKLAELALKYLHPITETHLYDSDSEFFHPSGFFWRVGDEGFLLRCFHLHPVAIHPRATSIEFAGTIDDDLLQNCDVHADETHIVTDSDEILWLETSDIDNAVPTPPRGGLEEIFDWARNNTNAYHHTLISHSTRLHTGQQTPELWQAAQARSDEVVASVLDALRGGPITPRKWKNVGLPGQDYPPMWTTFILMQDIVPVLFTLERNALGVVRDLRRYRPETLGAWIVAAAALGYLALFATARFFGRWVYRTFKFCRRSARRLRGR